MESTYKLYLSGLIDISSSFNQCLHYVKMSCVTCCVQWTPTTLQYKCHHNQRLDQWRALPSTVSSKLEEKGQGLADLADGLTNLVDIAYPELEDMAKEQLALNHFLSQIESPHITFSARQKRPKTIDVCKVDANDALDAIEEPKLIGANVVTSLPDMMKQVRFLVDTGAAISLLNSTVWRTFSVIASLRLQPWLGARVIGVDGSRLSCYWLIKGLRFHYKDQIETVPVIQPDLSKLLRIHQDPNLKLWENGQYWYLIAIKGYGCWKVCHRSHRSLLLDPYLNPVEQASPSGCVTLLTSLSYCTAQQRAFEQFGSGVLAQCPKDGIAVDPERTAKVQHWPIPAFVKEVQQFLGLANYYHRKELLSVVSFTAHFRLYLLGHRSTLQTDHAPLTWLYGVKEPEGQVALWLEKLQELDFKIIHQPEKQMEDQELQLIINAKQFNEHITPAQEAAQSLELRWLLKIWDQFPVSNGVLYPLFLDTAQTHGSTMPAR
ncbi:hypothetical protein EMCRGX_G034730 [Ephydatia muelleri]